MSRPGPKDVVRALRRAHRLPDDVGPRMADLERRLADAVRELGRMGPQLAALETRVEELAARLAPSPTGDAADVEAARNVLEEVRAEHARVRARISAATVFEERLRVLEERAGVDSATGLDKA
ncbi:uncharacterized protein involved in exopolysaccharide biosynthesis [Nocardioides aromaticivorans]|uniref:Uncharacterized protein involved in exopolysaccharide biosynthesis n=1 Tax=Nocardioides aromaticivorans TaxID=200618 RepID=A0A7Y9ZIF7_9ACTN|nr:hypothetical protein [Nocardioides aromaticivorans]NYI45470.1 uncharacterized protein involved in exopolysaccharide biosynthesis [Nocardioides aromaticivorans]